MMNNNGALRFLAVFGLRKMLNVLKRSNKENGFKEPVF